MIISTLAQSKNEKPKFSEFLATQLQVQTNISTATTIIEYQGKCELLSLLGTFYTSSGYVKYRITCDNKVYDITDRWTDSTACHWLMKELNENYFNIKNNGYDNYKNMPFIDGFKKLSFHSVNNNVYPLILKETAETIINIEGSEAFTNLIYNDFKANSYLKVEIIEVSGYSSKSSIQVAVGVM